MSGSGFDGTGANGRPVSFLSTASTSVPGIKSDFTYRILDLCSDFLILIPHSDESPSEDGGLRPSLFGIQEENPGIGNSTACPSQRGRKRPRTTPRHK